MSKKANPTAIGLFIVIGVALAVTGLLLFSSSKLFTPTKEFILYFNESLNGLSEGAPLKLRGVTIGSVKRVMIRFNQAENDTSMPVIVELQEDLLDKRLDHESVKVIKKRLQGTLPSDLRATLKAESLLTGVLYIDVNKVSIPAPAVHHQIKNIYPEIPTQPTEIQEMINNLSKLDIKGLEEKISGLITRMDTTLGALKMQEINENLTNLLASADKLLRSPDVTNLLVTATTTLTQYRSLAGKLDTRVDSLADSATNALGQASKTLEQLRGDTASIRGLLAPDSALQQELSYALNQLGNAAEAISGLAEFLKQHPNALITGRESTKKKP